MACGHSEIEHTTLATHFNFVETVLYPGELQVNTSVNSVAARGGQSLGHVRLGPVGLGLESSAEARRIAAAFTAVADELATIKDGTWSDTNRAEAGMRYAGEDDWDDWDDDFRVCAFCGNGVVTGPVTAASTITMRRTTSRDPGISGVRDAAR